MYREKELMLKREVVHLYGDHDFLAKTYAFLRLKLSPLLKLERHVPQTGTILDLGCGTGIFANILHLGSPKRKILGVDLSKSRVETAKKVSNKNSHLDFVVGDVNTFYFKDYEIITLIDLLHHMPFHEQEDLLRKIYLRMHDEGLLLIKDLEKSPYWKYIFHYIQDSLSYRGSRLYFLSAQEMQKLLTGIGFGVEIISLASGYPHPHVAYKCIK